MSKTQFKTTCRHITTTKSIALENTADSEILQGSHKLKNKMKQKSNKNVSIT